MFVESTHALQAHITCSGLLTATNTKREKWTVHNCSVDGDDRPDRGGGHVISNPTETTSFRGEKSVTVSQHKPIQQRPFHFVCGYPGVCRVSSCVLSGRDDPIVWMEVPLQIGDRPVRITGNEHHHVLGILCESSLQSLDSMGNGFQRPIIDHGDTLTVIRQ